MKTEIPHGIVIEKQLVNVKTEDGAELKQGISRPEKKVRGDREVECAKSCRACCNIDDADFGDNKVSASIVYAIVRR